MSKKLIILGGTGFLGYTTAKLALERGYEVASVSLNDINLEGWYPKEIKVTFLDVFEASEDELVEVMKGYDYMVYSIGPDDRETPPAPAYEFFHERLVNHCGKAFRAAERAGVKKSVVFNSYFSYFDRRYPEMKLAEKHPYVRARVEQADLLLKQRKNMEVVILELPYIFGSMPERTPLWKNVFLDRFVNGQKVIFFPKGSTTMTAVSHIGEAALGAIEYGKDGERYPIGDQNKPYDFFLNEMTKTVLNGKPRKIIHPPVFLCAMGGDMIGKKELKQGRETGLNFKLVMKEIMSKDLVVEEEVMDKVNAELHISRGGLEESLRETMLACYPDGSFK
ncbi:MAG: NAD(P)H-binding protein [Candidatus Onthovivens sp.]|nr:NAD(P)H-binding protein [Candidatus Onthovivens sp.]